MGDVVADRYQLERIIGRGGMGLVFAARHLQLQQQVAIKFLLPEFAEQRGWLERFLREAQVAFALRNEHVVRVFDVNVLDNAAPYIVMEYLEGYGLREVIRQRGPLPLEEAVWYVLQACEALAEAHAQGYVHRDLKPSNLFITFGSGGAPLLKVLDFGIVKAAGMAPSEEGQLTGTGEVLGSPYYMSPEQLRHRQDDVDPRSDIWALGVNLYHMLTGRLPFHGDTTTAMMLSIVMDPPLPIHQIRPDLPMEVHAIVEGCLQKDRERRFPSVAALAAAIAPFAPAFAQTAPERLAAVMAGRGATPPAMSSAVPRAVSPDMPTRVEAPARSGWPSATPASGALRPPSLPVPEVRTGTMSNAVISPEIAAAQAASETARHRARRRAAFSAAAAGFFVALAMGALLLLRGPQATPEPPAAATGAPAVAPAPELPAAQPSPPEPAAPEPAASASAATAASAAPSGSAPAGVPGGRKTWPRPTGRPAQPGGDDVSSAIQDRK